MIEIEKKWLLVEEDLNTFTSFTLDVFKSHFKYVNHNHLYDYVRKHGDYIEQYYIKSKSVRNKLSSITNVPLNNNQEVRIRFRNGECILTTKEGNGYERIEINHIVNGEDVKFIKKKASVVKKHRLVIPYESNLFEFDAYHDRKLLICECEVENVEDLQTLPVLGIDVTNNKIYKNINLV
jgi:CYTH domain-containing protein